MPLNELQTQVRNFDLRFGWTQDTPTETALHMGEELGEIIREILKLKGYKAGGGDRQALSDEVCDLIYLSLKLASHYNIDLDEAWMRIQERYEKK